MKFGFPEKNEGESEKAARWAHKSFQVRQRLKIPAELFFFSHLPASEIIKNQVNFPTVI